MSDDAGSERTAEEWATFERRVRAAYDATPGRAPRIAPPDFSDYSARRRRGARVVWTAGALAAVAAALLLLLRTERPALPPLPGGGPVVQFALSAPGATRVAVVGDFNQWDPHASPLARSADGRWQRRVSMPAGRHEYAFVIDNRRWVTDPLALQAPDLGFGQPNSVVLAAGQQ